MKKYEKNTFIQKKNKQKNIKIEKKFSISNNCSSFNLCIGQRIPKKM